MPNVDQIDPLILQAAENLRKRYGQRTVPPPDSVLEWAERYRRIDGQPFELDDFEPIRALYEDEHPRIAVIKPAQRGVSEWAICYVFYALEHGADKWVVDGKKNGINVGYIFPKREALLDFSKERISGLKEESPHLMTMLSGDESEFDSLGFKKIGNSCLYLRGGAVSNVMSFPADVLVLDEFDQMDRASVAMVRRRLNASKVKRELMISTPTYPGRGIHAAYLSSDQRIYQSKCPHCEDWVSFEFFRDVLCDGEPYAEVWKHWSQERIETADVTLHCPSCRETIDDAQRIAKGRWKVQRPEYARTHGYWVPWWPFRFIELKSLALSAVSEDAKEVEELYRSDLGLPYGAGGNGVTAEMLAQCSAEAGDGMPTGGWHDTTLGADIGTRINYRITSLDATGRIWVRAMGTVPNWEGTDSLDDLMRRYKVRMAVVDYEPEIRNSLDFCKRWPHRAVAAIYPANPAGLKGQLYVRREDAPTVNVNRTMAMDDVQVAIARAREIWPKQFALDPDIVSQMEAPTRVSIEDDNGQLRPSWIHTTPDHWFHAAAYDLIARRLLPNRKPFAVAVGGERPMVKAYQEYVTSNSRSIGAPIPGVGGRQVGRDRVIDPRLVR